MQGPPMVNPEVSKTPSRGRIPSSRSRERKQEGYTYPTDTSEHTDHTSTSRGPPRRAGGKKETPITDSPYLPPVLSTRGPYVPTQPPLKPAPQHLSPSPSRIPPKKKKDHVRTHRYIPHIPLPPTSKDERKREQDAEGGLYTRVRTPTYMHGTAGKESRNLTRISFASWDKARLYKKKKRRKKACWCKGVKGSTMRAGAVAVAVLF